MREYYRALEPAAYLGAAVILVDQGSQLLAPFLSAMPRESVWRFQAATLVVGRQSPLLFVGLLVAAVAWQADRPRLFRAAGLGLQLVAVGLLLAGLVLWIDGPAARLTVPAEQLRSFIGQWIRFLGLAGLGTVGFGWTGWRLNRTLK